jgi:hypothetical protein
MPSNKKLLVKKAILFVSIIFLLYTIYHAVFSTIFLYHFIPNIGQLPAAIQVPQNFNSPFPWTLIIIQEFATTTGIYLRLIGGVLAATSAFLFYKDDSRYVSRLRYVILFEALYFASFIPSGIIHSLLSFSELTFAGFNLYTGVSYSLQGLLIVPILLLLSMKVKVDKGTINLRWIGIAAPLYVFGIWIKHAFFWFSTLSMTTSSTLFETVGMINQTLTLLVSALILLYAYTPLIRNSKKINLGLFGTSLSMIGIHFVIYFIISIWVPIYSSYLYLTEFWMVSVIILGLNVLLKARH